MATTAYDIGQTLVTIFFPPHLPYEPYAPVRCQLFGLVRAINRRRKVAGLELVPWPAVRLRHSPVRHFAEEDLEDLLARSSEEEAAESNE